MIYFLLKLKKFFLLNIFNIIKIDLISNLNNIEFRLSNTKNKKFNNLFSMTSLNNPYKLLFINYKIIY